MNTWLCVRGMGSCEAAQVADLGGLLPPLLTAYYGAETAPALRRVPRYARMGLFAALQALASAGWKKGHETEALSCLIGSAFGSVEMSMDYMDSLLDAGPRLSSPTAFSHAVNNMGAGLVSLLLQTRGACQTLAQFELSFAGALTAATHELASGRATRVLVGALEESDPRFVQSCPEVNGHGHATAGSGSLGGLGTQAPQPHEGAYFFCLELATAQSTSAKICVRWTADAQGPNVAQPALQAPSVASVTSVTSVKTSSPDALPLIPLSQPAAIFAALQNQQPALCHCRDSVYGRAADVEVSYATLES